MNHNPPADRTLARPVIPLRLSQSCALNCLRASQSGRLKEGFDFWLLSARVSKPLTELDDLGVDVRNEFILEINSHRYSIHNLPPSLAPSLSRTNTHFG